MRDPTSIIVTGKFHCNKKGNSSIPLFDMDKRQQNILSQILVKKFNMIKLSDGHSKN